MNKFRTLLASPAALTGMITSPEDVVKTAGVESPDEVQLENDFANMAFTFLQDRAPKLLPYLLGFEVVEREEDGSKAVGIFAFQVGEDYYYVPAFFLKSQIRGMDLLFSKRTNSFMPLRESWVDYILNRQSVSLGEGAPQSNKLLQDFEQPNFDFVAAPPNVKSGHDVNTLGAQCADAWNEMQESTVRMLETDTAFKEAYACAIARVSKQPLPINKSAGVSVITTYLQQHGGPEAAAVLMDKIAKSATFANAFLQFYDSLPSVLPEKFAAELAPVEKQAARVSVVTEVQSGMTDEDRKRLVRDGFTVLDRRGPGVKSEVFSIDFVKTFANPDTTGAYSVVLVNGSLVKCWIFTNVVGLDGILVVHPQRKFYFSAEPGAVFASGSSDDNVPSLYTSGLPPNRMQAGKTYFLLDEAGNATVSFRVRSIVTENRRRTRIMVSPYESIDHKARGSNDPYCDCQTKVEQLELAQHSGKATFANNRIVVPDNYRAVELKRSGDAYSIDDDTKRDEYRAAYEAFQPGDLVDLDEALMKSGTHKLDVYRARGDSEYYLQLDGVAGAPLSYKGAIEKLAVRFDIDTDTAYALLKTATDNGKANALVKFGQSVSMGAPPPQSFSVDSYSGVPVEQAMATTIPGQTMGMPPPDQSSAYGYNLGGQSAQESGGSGGIAGTMDAALQAANSGQKQVFDHSTVGGLARVYDISAVIDSYIPDMSKSLDRVGRILFIFYWKGEEFAERYGVQDMAEMEDMLRGVFKSFGDLVLKLKEKAVDADAGSGVTAGQ